MGEYCRLAEAFWRLRCPDYNSRDTWNGNGVEEFYSCTKQVVRFEGEVHRLCLVSEA